jgi:CRP/FNR family transcriptional regulator, cyclic AMP receptor protein
MFETRDLKMNRWREQGIKRLPMEDFLEPLSVEEVEELAVRSPDIHLMKGEEFYRQDQHNGGLFFIRSGRVQVYKLSLLGKQLTLVVLSAGMVLTGRRMWNLYAQAMEPSVVAFIRRQDLERLIRERPEVGLRLIDLLADDLQLMDELLSDVIYKGVPARLAGLILRLLASEGVVSSEGFTIPSRYTHAQLGYMIGARRVAVTRALAHLREAGLVETSQRHIYVRDTDDLEHAAAREK